MIEYKIVTATNTDQLENRVADLIDLGFVPIGGVSAAYSRSGPIWVQSMTRVSADLPPIAEEIPCDGSSE